MKLTEKQRDAFKKMFNTIWQIQGNEDADDEILEAAEEAEMTLDYLLQLIHDSGDVEDFDEDNIPF